MLKQGDSVGIVVNSNGQSLSQEYKIESLIKILEGYGLNIICSPYIYSKDNVFSSNAKQKVDIMMKFYQNKDIKAIFDISGGDLANSIIDLLDYQTIKDNPKPFFGYSDLTCVINALYTSTKQINILYQVKNIIDNEKQQSDFYDSLFEDKTSLYDFQYRFIQGYEMAGIVVGGNIRCLLKLAGTKYFPDIKDKILFLESLGGESALMYSHLVHLKQLGVFDMINGIILGSFTVMEKNQCQPSIEELVKSVAYDIPIVKTEDIGHSKDSKALMIGRYLKLR